MAFSINEIRSQLAGGGARPNLFRVQIDTKDAAANIKVPFMVQAAALPASNRGRRRPHKAAPPTHRPSRRSRSA